MRPFETAGDGGLTLRQGGELVVAYQAVESALFGLAGRWSAEPGSPGAQLYFFAASQQHAWHAELWAARRPMASGLGAPGCGLDAEPARSLLETLGALGEGGSFEERSVRRLSGWCRVLLPRLAVTYERHRQRAVPSADGPLLRALRHVLMDVHESWTAGEGLLQSELATGDLAAAAAGAQGALEAAVARAGSTAGLIAWPAVEGPQPGGGA
jgi:hypothetical protein